MSEPNLAPEPPAPARPPREREMLPAASLAAIPIRRIRPAVPAGADAAPPQPAAAPAAAPPSAAPGVPTSGDPVVLTQWWSGLRRGRPFPAPADLDTAGIAASWPEAVMLGYDAAQGTVSGATRLGEAKTQSPIIDYSAMLTEWLIGVGRQAGRRGGVVHEARVVPTPRGNVGLRIMAFPLSVTGAAIDKILCRIGPA
jgi:hypothetical protein